MRELETSSSPGSDPLLSKKLIDWNGAKLSTIGMTVGCLMYQFLKCIWFPESMSFSQALAGWLTGMCLIIIYYRKMR